MCLGFVDVRLTTPKKTRDTMQSIWSGCTKDIFLDMKLDIVLVLCTHDQAVNFHIYVTVHHKTTIVLEMYILPSHLLEWNLCYITIKNVLSYVF